MQPELSEADLALVHALQHRPRAAWSELAPVLGVSAATLAARWHRLRADGLSWVTAYPVAVVTGPSLVALVEVDCAAGTVTEVSTRLAADPRVATIEHAARGRDLILTVFAGSFADMASALLDDLAVTPGVVSTRAHIAARIHLEGSRWRLDALDAGQLETLRAQDRADRGDPVPPVDLRGPTYAPLVAALGRDGRASATELAAATGRPASTVRRQLSRLIRSRSVVFRCEVAQLRTRWPVCVTWWCRVPGAAQDDLVAQLRAEPRVRLCLSLTGPANFLVTMWTASLPDLMAVQTWLEGRLGGGEIVDTSVILRTRKRMGWMLHPDGRCTDEVVPLAVVR